MSGTILIHIIVLAILLLFGFAVPLNPPSQEGIMVNFGTDQTGSGNIEPSPPANQEETTIAPPPPEPVKSRTEEPVLTQNKEEAPTVKNVDPDAEKKHLEKIEADRIKKQETEAEKIRKAQEDLEKAKIAAEEKRRSDIMNRTRNALANAKNTGTSSTGEGITGGPGNQGVPNGSVDSQVHGEGGGLGNSGISYDLQGRGFQKLPLPKYEYQGEGRVVVEVSVDRSGKVVQAIPGIKGSTTLDEYLLKVAKEAAMAAEFKVKADAPVIQKGTITYNFILK